MSRNKVLDVLLVVYSVAMATGETSISTQPVDPCNKPSLCQSGQFLPNPDDCRQYFVCNFDLSWKLETCLNGLLFNNISLTCRNDSISCAEQCPAFTGTTATTLSPGVCDNDNIPGTCIYGDKVPDRSDCRYYYQCITTGYMRLQCQSGFGFNIDTKMCVPLTSIDCDYRCKTPEPTTAILTTAGTLPSNVTLATTTLTDSLTTFSTSSSLITSSRTTDFTSSTINDSVFHTTESSTDTAAACSPDSRPLELDGYSGTFVSPNYPGNYFNDAYCQWIITAVVQTAVVTLDFEFFSTESCCDFVELHDGDNGKAPSIVTLSGFLSPPPGGFNSTQRNMFIRFTTDSTITDRGFSAVYSSEAPGDPCSPASRPLELIGYSGSFTSSNYPSDYYDNSICQWRIIAAENSGIVELSFNSFNTESCCDIVDIHDGDIAKSPLITSLSGDYNPPPGGISSSQRYMFVSFVTDATDTSRGFSAAYTNADPCSPALQPLQLKAPTGTFTSSNYPSNYDNNADCQWLITAVRPNAIILVNFTDFNTESCCDAVNIYNGDSLKAPLIVKLSGSYTTLPGGYESTQQFMYVRFVTDDSINSRGFKATYTSEGPGDACSPADRPLDLTGNSGTLTSSNYPSNYDNEADCQWRITAVNTIQVVILDFTSFDTESCCDKVNIYNGDSNKSPLISTLSGSYQTPPTGITTTQMYMFVRFTSDDTVTGRGFQATYRSAVSN